MDKRENHFLEKFLYPDSVAVVGASRNPMRPNYNLVANLARLGLQGKVYPVNPETNEIAGVKTYPDLKSIEGPIDLAAIAVPYNLALPTPSVSPPLAIRAPSSPSPTSRC